jgi:hypothetical protein
LRSSGMPFPFRRSVLLPARHHTHACAVNRGSEPADAGANKTEYLFDFLARFSAHGIRQR